MSEELKAKLYTPVFKLKEQKTFEPVDTMANTYKMAEFGFLALALVAGARNTFSTEVIPTLVRAKHTGILVGFTTVAAAAYQYVASALANLRQKNDGVNSFYGGFVSGAIGASVTRKLPVIFGSAALLGSLMGLSTWAGGFTGLGAGSAYDSMDKNKEVPQLQEGKQGLWDVTYRRPLSETVSLLGQDSVVLKK